MLTMGSRRYRSPQQMAAPIQQPLTPREEGTRGCRRRAEIRVRPRGARRKAFSGGRPIFRGGASGPAPGKGPVVVGGTAGDRSIPSAASSVSGRCRWQ